MKVTCDITINASIESVFGVFSDLDLVEKHVAGIKEIELIEGSAQMQAGTKWKETREMFGKEASETMWVTAIESDKKYVVEAQSHGVHYISTYTFETMPEGTRVSMSFEGVPKTVLAKVMGTVMAPLMKNSIKKMLKKDMEELQVVIEGGEAQ